MAGIHMRFEGHSNLFEGHSQAEIGLVREWNGRPYQVEMLEDGFQMDGKRYRSLSSIARKITGAHWSGPRFFGLGAS